MQKKVERSTRKQNQVLDFKSHLLVHPDFELSENKCLRFVCFRKIFNNSRYLRLLTEEHTVIKSEQLLSTEVSKADEAEKAAFDELSSTLRTSRAKEQEQSVFYAS